MSNDIQRPGIVLEDEYNRHDERIYVGRDRVIVNESQSSPDWKLVSRPDSTKVGWVRSSNIEIGPREVGEYSITVARVRVRPSTNPAIPQTSHGRLYQVVAALVQELVIQADMLQTAGCNRSCLDRLVKNSWDVIDSIAWSMCPGVSLKNIDHWI